MNFIPWTGIESFHNIRKFLKVDPTGWWAAQNIEKIAYKCKVKLHGTNAAVQLHHKGEIVCQSRESIVTPEKDNAGFARWVMTDKDKWNKVIDAAYVNGLHGWVIYGEWIGPGIQKGVAVSEIPKKCFAVFAARSLDEQGLPGDRFIVEPWELKTLVDGIPDTYVLPWYTGARRGSDTIFSTFHMNPLVETDGLKDDLETINQWVDKIEAEDPWVQETFGVKGTGEGLVFYPIDFKDYSDFCNLVFKAKGEAHKNIKTSKPAQIDAEKADSIDSFVELVLTSARLHQGVNVIGGLDVKLTGKFIGWISSDIQKECQDEMEASNLNWKQIQNTLVSKAREWFIAESKKL